jgi:hypothetical protein
MMQDHLLNQKARFATPNTFRDSKAGGGCSTQSTIGTKGDRQKQKDAWQNNMYVVQAHAFNNLFEP